MHEVQKAAIALGVKQYGSVAETARHFGVSRSILFRKVK